MGKPTRLVCQRMSSECAVKPARTEQVQQDHLTAGRHFPAAECRSSVLGRWSQISPPKATSLLNGLKRDLIDRDNDSFEVGDRFFRISIRDTRSR